MTTTNKMTIRNDSTGELAPPHILGTDEHGRTLYQAVDGWTPVGLDGAPVEVSCDVDGNWLVCPPLEVPTMAITMDDGTIIRVSSAPGTR